MAKKALCRKKILVISGSPRKNGNTARLVKWFAAGARSAGAMVSIVDAAKLKSAVNGCTSCRMCQKSAKYECVIKDEITPVLRKMAASDVIAMATPLYFYTPSAQLKLVMDRMFSLYKWDNTTDTFTTPMEGKTLALIVSAYEDIGLDTISKPFKFTADYSGMKYMSLLVPNAGESGQIEEIKGIRDKARKFGVKAAK
ncbi:MAG: flavodoxin family protein [Candidatus Omnitrophica bacterium]|nr:flavodoxin family protein [Candidatus Omnitrophota bacterium]